MIAALIVLSVLMMTVFTVAIIKDGEWNRFMDNNRKQPKDEEL